MKNIKVRHIIGTIALLTTIMMNFTYAYHNYGIPKKNKTTKVYATTAAPTYREVLEVEYKNCPSYTYDVIVYAKKTPEQIWIDSVKGWKNDSIFGYHRVSFYSKSMQEAYNAAKKYAMGVNEMGLDYAEIDMNCYISLTHREAHRVNCSQSGNLPYCETQDAICDPLEYNSSLER